MSTPVTLDSTSSTTTAGASTATSRVILSDDDLLVSRPNYRVIVLEKYCAVNKRGKPYQVYCLDDKLSTPGSKPICLYQNKWHGLLVSQKGTSAVGPEVPEVHKYDINTPISTLSEALGEEPPPPLKEPPSIKTPTLAINVRSDSPLRNPKPTTTTTPHSRRNPYLPNDLSYYDVYHRNPLKLYHAPPSPTNLTRFTPSKPTQFPSL